MYAKVDENLHVGSADIVNANFVKTSDITAIINLSSDHIDIDGVNCFDYVLPCQELLDDEIPKVINRLASIAGVIDLLHTNSKNVLICCPDGRNRSLLVASYYLISYRNSDARTLIGQMEYLYFTPEQKNEEAEYLKNRETRLGQLSHNRNEGIAINLDRDESDRYARRAAIRGLTIYSYKKILNSSIHKK